MVRIRDAVPGDAVAMADLNVRGWQKSFRGAVADDVIDSLDPANRRAYWEEHLPSSPPFFTWVADLHGEVAGFLHIGPNRDTDLDSGDIPEVYAIYVDPAHTGTGIGTRLMERALAYLDAGGFRAATLWTLRDVPATRGFYEALGWRPDGSEKADCRQTIHTVRQVRYRIDLPT
jgi:GNAT superfamily N-acetyltransferase